MHAVLGLLEYDGASLYNASVRVGPTGLVGKYREIHLPGLGVDKFVQPGNLGFTVCGTPSVRIGLNFAMTAAFRKAHG